MQNTALITGATSGIGLECAKILAQKDYNLLLVGRDADKLERVKERLSPHTQPDSKINFIKTDLATIGSAEEIATYCRKKKIHVEVLIQSAGLAEVGEFTESSPEKIEAMVNINILNLSLLSRHFARLMKKREKGYILHISSLAGFTPVPFWATYAGTQSYIINFSQAMTKELEKTGVKVSCLAVGPTDTQFWKKAGVENLPRVFPRSMRMTAKQVATLGIKALFKGKRLIIPGKLNKTVPFLARTLPNTYFLDKLKRKQEDYIN